MGRGGGMRKSSSLRDPYDLFAGTPTIYLLARTYRRLASRDAQDHPFLFLVSSLFPVLFCL